MLAHISAVTIIRISQKNEYRQMEDKIARLPFHSRRNNSSQSFKWPRELHINQSNQKFRIRKCTVSRILGIKVKDFFLMTYSQFRLQTPLLVHSPKLSSIEYQLILRWGDHVCTDAVSIILRCEICFDLKCLTQRW